MTLSKTLSNKFIFVLVGWLLLEVAFPQAVNNENVRQLLVSLESPALDTTIRVSAARELLKHLDDPSVRDIYEQYIDKIQVARTDLIRGDPETYFPLVELLGLEASNLDWQINEYLKETNPIKIQLWEKVLNIKLNIRIDITTPLLGRIDGADVDTRARARRFLSGRRVEPGPPLSSEEISIRMDWVEKDVLSFLGRGSDYPNRDAYPAAKEFREQEQAPHRSVSVQSLPAVLPSERNFKTAAEASSIAGNRWFFFWGGCGIVFILLVARWGFLRRKNTEKITTQKSD